MLKTVAKVHVFPQSDKKEGGKKRFFVFFVARKQDFDYFCKQICINHIKKDISK